MKAAVYNVSVLAGVALVGFGVGIHDLGAGLCVSGVLVLALTVFAAYLQARR